MSELDINWCIGKSRAGMEADPRWNEAMAAVYDAWKDGMIAAIDATLGALKECETLASESGHTLDEFLAGEPAP